MQYTLWAIILANNHSGCKDYPGLVGEGLSKRKASALATNKTACQGVSARRKTRATDLGEFPDDIGSVVHVGLQGLALRLELGPDLLLAALPLLRLLRQPRLALLEAGDHVLADLIVSEIRMSVSISLDGV